MPRFILAILAAVILVAVSYAVVPPTSAGDAVAAPPRIDRAELDRVIDVFDRRVEQHGDALSATHLGANLLARARLTGSLDDYRAARTAFETAVAKWPSRDALLGLATSAMALHDFATGRTVASRLLELDPEDSAAHLIVGDAWLELGDINRAVDSFDRAAAFAPGDPAISVRRAEVAHLTGKQNLAIDLAEEADRLSTRQGLSPRRLAFYPLLRADLLFDAGQYRRAEDQVEAAIALARDWAPVHASHGKVLAALGQVTEAVAAYEQALALQPDDPGWLASLGDLATLEESSEQAADFYTRAVALYTEEDPAIYGLSLARLYADRDIEPLEALRLATDDLARRPAIGSYDTYAWALFRAGRLQQARVAIDTAIQYGTEDGELWFHAAMISAGLGDTEQAIRELETLLTRNPNFHPVHARTAASLLGSLRSSS